MGVGSRVEASGRAVSTRLPSASMGAAVLAPASRRQAATLGSG